jgi:hypothetical protein
MNKLYRIYRYDRNRNREVLAGGIDKKTAEEALRYAGYNPKKVYWETSSSHLSDPRAGNTEVFEGEYRE